MCCGLHVLWRAGAVVCVCSGVHVLWHVCSMACVCHGVHVCWCACAVARVCSGVHVLWRVCALGACSVACVFCGVCVLWRAGAVVVGLLPVSLFNVLKAHRYYEICIKTDPCIYAFITVYQKALGTVEIFFTQPIYSFVCGNTHTHTHTELSQVNKKC